MDVFKIVSYRDIIKEKVKENGFHRGYQRQLAEAGQCNPSYLSQVINSHVHLTTDQAAGFCDSWGFTEDETDYFIGLVLFERSNSNPFKKSTLIKLTKLREKYLKISERFEDAEKLRANEHLMEYFNIWYFSAINTLLTIPEFDSVAKIACHLGLKEDLVQKCVDKLIEMGFASKDGENLKALPFHLYLTEDAPMRIAYHANWRQQANRRMQMMEKQGIHYTAVASLSKDDFEILQTKIYDLIKQSRDTVSKSKEEMIACLICDFFPVQF
jgi:uncharacterized protein (TIGR02147 family)